jgi:hypothetical protein
MNEFEYEWIERILNQTLLFAVIGMLVAVAICRDPVAALSDRMFWRRFLRAEGLIYIVLSIGLVTVDIYRYAVWGLETTPPSFYLIWHDIDTPLHLGFIFVSLVLGALMGWRYYKAQTALNQGSTSVNWLVKTLTLIGMLPIFLSMTIVLCAIFYRGNGLFYSWTDATHISRVEWKSETRINFRLTNYHISDTMGAAIPYCDYEADLASGDVNETSCGELQPRMPAASDPEPKPVPTFEQPLASPEGTMYAYVVKHYDLYVKPIGGRLFSGRAVYQYASLDFFRRYDEELGMLLIYSLPISFVLLVSWAYQRLNKKESALMLILTAVLTMALFLGSLTGSRSAFDLHRYLWASIP